MAEIVKNIHGDSHEVVDFNDDVVGARIGMWFFLFTELMLFGGMFITYAVYFFDYTEDFIQASRNMNLWLGGLNTVILLISAFTIGLSVLFLKAGDIAKSKGMLLATIVFSIAFLVVKYFEWTAEFDHGIWPDSPTLLAMSNGANMYFGLYFTLTGLHALHIILGIAAMVFVYRKMNNGTISKDNFIVHENVALYWDYVHLVWVFVVPLFYMIGFADIGGHH
jgi:cytochrome c oxidase subunit 3